MSQEYKLIFVIVQNPNLGYLIEAYRIGLLKNGQWSAEIKKIADFSSQFLTFPLLEHEENILKLIQITREESVYLNFSMLKEKKITSTNTFFSEQTFVKHLVPYVSKHTVDIINRLIDYEIPIYFRSEDKGIIHETPLHVELNPVEPRFNFALLPQSFTYQLTVYHQNNQLDLTNAKIITQTPCFFKLNNTLYEMPENFDGQLLKPFQKTDTIHIPKEKVNLYLQTFVSKILKQYRVEVSGFSVEEIRSEPVPVIGLNKLHRKTPVAELFFKYSDGMFWAFSSQEFILKLMNNNGDVSFCKIFRNPEAEKKYIRHIKDAGFIELQPGYFISEKSVHQEYPSTMQDLIYELSLKSGILQKKGITFDIMWDNKTYIMEEPEVSSAVSYNNDWFDIRITIKVKDFSIPFQKIIPYIIKGSNEYRLPDGSFFIIPEEWFSRYKDLSILSEKDEKCLKIHKSQVNLIDCIQGNCHEQISEKIKTLINQNIPVKIRPAKLNASLREYQHKGFEWLTHMNECGLGGCLADDMGLGKTIQMLTYFLHIRDNGNLLSADIKSNSYRQPELFDKVSEERVNYTHLIVAPLSLMHNWQEEINKFAPCLKTILYTGPERFRLYHNFQYADIVLTSYGIIRNDYDVLKHFDFHTIVLDESQCIKNPESKSYDSLLVLSSKQRFVLTGTPIENSLTDIWTQMNFLNPRMLGSLKTFKDTYVIPVEKNNDEQASKRIQKLIGSFILRRTKSEVTPELPELTEKICYCTMTDQQKSIYEKKKSEIRNFLIENASPTQRSRRNIIALSGLMKLRLIANHPKLTDPTYDGESGKFEEILQHIEKSVSEGNKTIVFSQFIKHLNLFRDFLNQRQIGYEVLTGQTSQNDRQKNINQFKRNDDVKLFLMTLKAGGVGLNLTEADYVFIIDPWWNPATEKQAINRTHRIGQDKKIFSYKFISKETIEEKIMILQQKKSDLFNSIINSTTFGKLSEEELMTLFE